MEVQHHDFEYLNLLKHVLENGVEKTDRTGTGTLSIFSQQMRFNLRNNSIPLLTTKRMHVKSIIHEILWYLQGETNVKYLQDNGVRIWNEWANEDGDLGPIYGKQWRRWAKYKKIPAHHEGYEWVAESYEVTFIDQIADVIHRIKNNPNDRRMLVSAWNVGELDQMALPPCHYSFQFWVNTDKKELSCQLNQRSADVFLGVPFNIVQYSILTHMIAQVCGLTAAEFVWCGGDVHLYNNHKEQAIEQLSRNPYPSPQLKLNGVKNIDDFRFEDFKVIGYESHPTIKAPVSV